MDKLVCPLVFYFFIILKEKAISYHLLREEGWNEKAI